MEQTVEVLTARLNKAAEVFRTMKAEMVAKDKEIEDLKNMPVKETGVSQEKYDEVCAQVVKLTEEKNAITDAYDKQSKEMVDKKQEEEQLNIELKKKDILLADKCKTISELSEKVQNLDKELVQKNTLIQDANRMNSELAKTLEDIKAEFTEVETNFNNTKTEYTTLKEKYDKLVELYKKANESTIKANKDIIDTTNKYNELSKKYEDLLNTAKDYQKSVKERDENIQKAMDVLTDQVSQTKQNISNHGLGNYPGMHDFLSM